MKVEPKNDQKRPIYETKLFYATKCDRESISHRFYIEMGFIFFKFRVSRMLTQRCYWHITLGLCRPLGKGITLDKMYFTRNVRK